MARARRRDASQQPAVVEGQGDHTSINRCLARYRPACLRQRAVVTWSTRFAGSRPSARAPVPSARASSAAQRGSAFSDARSVSGRKSCAIPVSTARPSAANAASACPARASTQARL